MRIHIRDIEIPNHSNGLYYSNDFILEKLFFNDNVNILLIKQYLKG